MENRRQSDSSANGVKSRMRQDGSTASEFSPSPSRSLAFSQSSEISSHSDVMQTLLLHKEYVMKVHPNPPTLEGFPPIKMLDADACQKAIGYREKRIPYAMRQEGELTRDLSMRSCISRDGRSKRNVSKDTSKSGLVPRDNSTRLLPNGDLPNDGSFRQLPREMSRRARMEQRVAERDSRRSVRNSSFRSACSPNPSETPSEPKKI
jgi:hypothetical protein